MKEIRVKKEKMIDCSKLNSKENPRVLRDLMRRRAHVGLGAAKPSIDFIPVNGLLFPVKRND